MQRALEAYRSGDLHIMSEIVRDELRKDQRAFLSWYAAGILAERMRDYASGILYLKLALKYMGETRFPPAMRRAAEATEGEIRFNLGRMFQHECEPHRALWQFDRAIALAPNEPGTWAQRGLIMLELGKPNDAERDLTRAMSLPGSETASIRYNRALAALLMGDYLDGFAGYEARWEVPDHLDKFKRTDVSTPRWDGQPTDLTVLILTEQGRGDQIQVARFLPEVQRRAPHLIVEAMGEMYELLRANYPTIQWLKRAEPLDPANIPPHDLHLPSMSLFYALGVTLETIPPAPYLKAA